MTAEHGSQADDLCRAARRLSALGFVAAHEGNLSCRLAGERALCTPTLMHKGDVTPADLCVVGFDLTRYAGQRRPTSEIRLHLELYKADPEIAAVVHCHSPYATAFSLTGQELPTGVVPEAEVLLGAVALVPYQTFGTQAYAESVRPFAREHVSAILCNHGQVTWGRDMREALWRAEVLEGTCRTLWIARQFGGGIRRLTPAQMRDLLAERPNFGQPPDPRLARGSDDDLLRNPEFGAG